MLESTFAYGLYISAIETGLPLTSLPPATRTLPSDNTVAVPFVESTVTILPVADHVLVEGS